MKMRKAAGLLILILCVFSLCACSFPRLDLINKISSEESDMVSGKSEEIIRCLTEGDRDGFTSLFCEEVRSREDFKRQVEEAFGFFRCEVYIRSEINELAGGGMSTEGGKRTEWYLSPEITYIEVLQPEDAETGEIPDRYYGVRYGWMITNEEHPQWEGLQHMEIYLLNLDESVVIGANGWLEE